MMSISLILSLLVIGVGSYLLVKLRFFFVLHPIRVVKDFLSENKSTESRRALFLALAGTLGVGNIFGVASGIIYGGPGTVFWLAVSSVFSSVLKYSECVLSFDSISDAGGGMHHAIKRIFPRSGVGMSLLYALACALLALFMGGAMQASAVMGAYSALSDSGGLLPAIIFALCVLFGTFGGGNRIEKITEKVIPLTTIIYILLCLLVILKNFHSLGEVISAIIANAVDPTCAVLGIGGTLLSRQFSEGFARGVLSNEAGCGTSSLAHTRSADRRPYFAGLSGICEVVFDTSVLCVLTALAVLCSVKDIGAYTSPMLLVSDALCGSLGSLSRILLLLSVAAFAYSTVICWYYYGSVCSSYLFSDYGRRGFGIMFFAFLIFGGVIPSRGLIMITDYLLFVLSVLTLSAVIKRRERIKELTLEK